MKKFIEPFQYITHELGNLSHVRQAELACQAGAKWIQYRRLNQPDEVLLEDIAKIAGICDDWGTTLIVTDHVHLNGRADIQGFHIEDMNADFLQLRAALGPDVTLGGSANTTEGLLRLAAEGADYAGLGPFAATRTKPNNYPQLGTNGYRQAIQLLREQQPDFPVVAVGGIAAADVPALMETGIYGIAVSAAVYDAPDFEVAYLQLYNLVKGA
ncbi:thiamine phosphate synthase [Pedobacter yulinensis]|uniref:Thiamine phosphate synthase n=1 Tax=Pedobacter yulinensis TaxID=2126353 RepID=A0A2T3HRW1_9SPHI|nr:thiamine phosphate synthase [Pedobacter yulinensis]PST85192.1 thiamine phosphate synthase [Pedobacter yulinensis]